MQVCTPAYSYSASYHQSTSLVLWYVLDVLGLFECHFLSKLEHVDVTLQSEWGLVVNTTLLQSRYSKAQRILSAHYFEVKGIHTIWLSTWRKPWCSIFWLFVRITSFLLPKETVVISEKHCLFCLGDMLISDTSH